jgi:hypothetical protein
MKKGVITISRGFGNGGHSIGKIAEETGFSTHTHEYMENCQRCAVAYEARR